MAKTIDFPATREKLQHELGETQEELASVEGRLGGLTLDVELGAGSQADVDRARAQRAQLTARVSELTAALASLDEREAEHEAAEAEAQRQRDLARLAELLTTGDAAGVKVARLARELAAACSEGQAASNEAIRLAQKHGENAGRARRWQDNAGVLVTGRLHELAPGIAGGVYFAAGKVDEAEHSITGKG